jgi:hypothetical protein
MVSSRRDSRADHNQVLQNRRRQKGCEGENRIAVFFPFTLFHPDHHTLGMNVAEFEVDQLSDTQSRRVSGHQ